MLTYIMRRVLLMIPTIIGITFMVFMIIAASPGGIGGNMLQAGGGAMQSQSGIAVMRAKLEDRYGLNEHPVVQYFRWLGRVSPVKFGQRDLVSPTDGLITRPRAIPEPAAWQWAEKPLPTKDDTLLEKTREDLVAQDEATRVESFKRVQRDYVEARARFTTDDALLRDALARYAEKIGRSDLVGKNNKPRVRGIARLTPDRSIPEYAEVMKLLDSAMISWGEAVNAREKLIGGMASKPHPLAGIGIIPGALSIAAPDLGVTFTGSEPVIEKIGRHLPYTLLINLCAFPIIYAIAIPSGMLAAARRGTIFDVGLGSLYIALYSIPVVLAGVLMVGFLTTPDYVEWFPTSGLHHKDAELYALTPRWDEAGAYRPGYLLDAVWHLVLPVTCAVYTGFAVLSKQTRAAMLENFSADYVRTAKAKGVAPRDVLFRHVFRNSLLPLITMFVTIFPAMLAGSVVIERIFSIQGMGWLVIEAINQRDRELILGNTLIVGMVNLLALLLADILYAMADPRITYK
jgi:ABC-type dipeptide/oligopeptide/nickel transport system permease component